MIIRIVRLSFRPEESEAFKAIFEASRERIVACEGCHKVELLQDAHASNVFMTYSHWDREANLNAYRDSDFFKETWAKTKQLFNDKPQAWSLEKINEA